MADDFADGWVDFEELVDRFRTSHPSLNQKDIQEYVKMYMDNWED